MTKDERVWLLGTSFENKKEAKETIGGSLSLLIGVCLAYYSFINREQTTFSPILMGIIALILLIISYTFLKESSWIRNN